MSEVMEGAAGGRGAFTPDVFTALYERWYPRVVDLCRRTGCGDADPEDVAQEAFLKAWAARQEYHTGLPFWPWIAMIAERTCVDHWRRTTRCQARTARVEAIRDTPPRRPDELAEEIEERAVMRRAFGGLRTSERRLMGLRDIEGWSYSDIAGLEQVTVSSVKSTLHRARRSLRSQYLRIMGAPAAVVMRHLRRWASHPALDLGGLAALGVAAALLSSSVPAAPRTGEAAADPETSDTTQDRYWPATVGGAAAAEGSAAGVDAFARTARVHAADDPRNVPVPTTPLSSLNNLITPSGENPDTFTLNRLSSSSDGSIIYANSTAQTSPLFRTTDSGRTWHRLPAVGFAGGTILVPPGRTDGRVLFAVQTWSFQVSEDGGATFRTVAPLGGGASVSPAFLSGDPRVLLGGQPPLEYRHDAGTVAPAPWRPAVDRPARNFAFSPSYPEDPRVLVGEAVSANARAVTPTAVSVCFGTECLPPTVLDGIIGLPVFAVAPDFARSGLAFAHTWSTVYRTTDGGRSFSRLPWSAAVRDLTIASDGTVYLANGSNGLFASDDAGSTWRQVTVPTKGWIQAVSAAGPLVVTVNTGLLCSADRGRTWAPRCP